ncbi:Crp/Fnr family transcriptional regulator [Pedobacter psychrophilus]|uniref:Crp/Fnr family transcriptional regulator n=1 Tax=Pedobacter psychrophilus TaxID=1826909 RepID=UPI001E2A0A7D|nr:Crp/Fnr family transcriptional regulator [Pedobacter psychrophilus]
MKISRNTVLEEQGKTPQYLYFVSSGFMRLFYYDENGDEQTTYLCSINGFIASFLCFINQIKATENVECVTDCEILRITNANLKKLIDESENFKKFSLIIFEQAIFSTANRANDLATLNAEQRYKKLIDNQPQLIQNIPIQYIASFLGMKPESLSRIRRQIIS